MAFDDPGAPRDPFGPVPFGHEEVLRARSKKDAGESALALQALGIPHVLQSGGAGSRILVSALDADRARLELRAYIEESVDWPPGKADAPPVLTSGIPGTVVFAIVIVAMFPIGRSGLFGLNWWVNGMMQSGSVAEGGEFWRTFTSLTLHVDLQHLIGNLVFGSVFAVLAAQTLGTGVAWLGTILAGAGGNLIESYLTDASHNAVGASTAIFGTLGLLVAAEWSRRGQQRLPWVRRVAPLFGGAVLFGWLGAGDGSGRVDVLAHATGFAVGAGLGYLCGRLDLPGRLSTRAQRVSAAAAMGLIAIAWVLALR